MTYFNGCKDGNGYWYYRSTSSRVDAHLRLTFLTSLYVERFKCTIHHLQYEEKHIIFSLSKVGCLSAQFQNPNATTHYLANLVGFSAGYCWTLLSTMHSFITKSSINSLVPMLHPYLSSSSALPNPSDHNNQNQSTQYYRNTYDADCGQRR